MGNRGTTNANSKRVQQEDVPVLKSHNNLRRDSLCLKKIRGSPGDVYSLNFVFSCTFDCIITIQLCASEFRSAEKDAPTLYFYTPPELENGSFQYKFSKGAIHEFPEKAFTLDFNKYDLEDMTTYKEDEYCPIVITIENQGRNIPQVYRHKCLMLILTKNSRGEYNILIKKQCLLFDKNIFKIEDIYGFEKQDDTGDFGDESTKECIICYTNTKNTVVYPCRHICLCNSCTQVVRMQNSKCPICRLEAEKFITVEIDKQDAEEEVNLYS
ncbi:unnamed protein product [Moneuplotes crassus]|uniref:RING-type E3 ubiquitin transferase n=1 Tax=Euplotes crassus TaxID=5936 RepID=A0AAD1XN62_EUPCR|nr:unnamed protein product [Moneuplotes crassus]